MKKLPARELGVGLVLFVLVLAVQLANPAFLRPENVRDLLIQCAPFAIMACGMTFVIILGEIDISVGSMAGLLAAALGTWASPSHGGRPLLDCVFGVLFLGLALGLVNGLLVVFARVPSIVATLGMLTVLRGVTELVLHGEWVTDLPPFIRQLGIGVSGGVPNPVLVALLVVAVSITLASLTPWGRRVYAIGSNPEAAKVRGLPVKQVKLAAFALMGLLTGVAVLVSAPQLSVVESGYGTGWELFVVTCVVVGGVSITGGRGSLWGVLLGVALLSIIRTALIFLRLGDQASYWERAIQGVLILTAVLGDRVSARRRAEVGA
ncbi:MAG: ABC transporter permease [Armatimonadetes bacterium]|nr:ABC transporter permease [Armatimonadota bacterium]